jgi:hypothetical protein
VTLQRGGHRAWLLLYGSLCFLSVPTVLFPLLTGAPASAYVIFAVATVFNVAIGVLCFVARAARIEVDADGLVIVNPFSRRRFQWSDIAWVRVGRIAMAIHPIEVADTSGRITRSFGVMELRGLRRPSTTLHWIAYDLAWRHTHAGQPPPPPTVAR